MLLEREGFVMREAPDKQEAAFQAALPQIKNKYNQAWVLIADGELEGAFPSYETAAKFVIANLRGKEILIRHTEEKTETAPFLIIEN
jgi:hypothetical protein